MKTQSIFLTQFNMKQTSRLSNKTLSHLSETNLGSYIQILTRFYRTPSASAIIKCCWENRRMLRYFLCFFLVTLYVRENTANRKSCIGMFGWEPILSVDWSTKVMTFDVIIKNDRVLGQRVKWNNCLHWKRWTCERSSCTIEFINLMQKRDKCLICLASYLFLKLV